MTRQRSPQAPPVEGGLDRLLDKGELAKYLRRSIRSIEEMQRRGDGPPRVVLAGRVYFREVDVRDWLASRVGGS